MKRINALNSESITMKKLPHLILLTLLCALSVTACAEGEADKKAAVPATEAKPVDATATPAADAKPTDTAAEAEAKPTDAVAPETDAKPADATAASAADAKPAAGGDEPDCN
jgi:hypothetical protein